MLLQWSQVQRCPTDGRLRHVAVRRGTPEQYAAAVDRFCGLSCVEISLIDDDEMAELMDEFFKEQARGLQECY